MASASSTSRAASAQRPEPRRGIAEPLAVGVHAVNRMNTAPDAIVAVVGAGTIGLALGIVLSNLGCDEVFLVDKIEEKLALAQSFGLQTIHADRDNPSQVIYEHTGGRRATGVFEAVGAAETVRTAYDLCDFGGTLVLIGNLAKEFTLPLQGVTSNEVTIRGSYGFTRAEFGEAV